jgi:hypothetical protein
MKKAVKKKAMGGALGALASGKLSGAIPGLIPSMLVDRYEDRKRAARDEQAKNMAELEQLRGMQGAKPTPMKKGGRIDGAAKRGKTKGRKC